MQIFKKFRVIEEKFLKYRSYRILKEAFITLSKKEVGLLPSYIAFFILLSFIPIITLIFDIISIILINNNTLLQALSDILPENVYGITVLLLDHNNSSWQLLTISNITLLFLASRIYSAFYRSYLIIYDVPVQPNFIRDKIIALINTILLIILIFILTLFIVFNTYIFKTLNINLVEFGKFAIFFNYFNIIIAIILISVVVTFLMYSVPHIKQMVKEVFFGSLIVTFGWIISSYGFKIYVENFANYQTIYKTFTTIIVFVTWIYMICYILIIGIAVNKAVSKITTHETI